MICFLVSFNETLKGYIGIFFLKRTLASPIANNPKSKYYNSETRINKICRYEKLFRNDYKYNYILVINYNEKQIPYKGSAIFLHLTKNYDPTAGCIALKEKDFLILIRLISKKTKIKIY